MAKDLRPPYSVFSVLSNPYPPAAVLYLSNTAALKSLSTHGFLSGVSGAVSSDLTPARTEVGRELQKRLGTVGVVADHYVEIAAKEILRGKAGEKGKPS